MKADRRLRIVHPTPARPGEVRPYWRRCFSGPQAHQHPFMDEHRAAEAEAFRLEMRALVTVALAFGAFVVLVWFAPELTAEAARHGWLR